MQGRELNNAGLAEALTAKTEFTPNEWEAFAVDDLCIHDFITDGSDYFRPNPMNAGSEAPRSGTEIKDNEALKVALQQNKVEFSSEEFDHFKIGELVELSNFEMVECVLYALCIQY